MPSTFSSFTAGTIANTDASDFVVGYESTQVNTLSGERRWTISTLANAVSAVMAQQLTNEINNAMNTVGNYPYLEYAWVTAPNTAGQNITANTITTLTLNTEVADTGSFGSLASNQITLAAGTYQYEVYYPIYPAGAPYLGRSGEILSLYNVTNSSYISRMEVYRSISSDGAPSPMSTTIFSGRVTLNTQSQLRLQVLSQYTALVGSDNYSSSTSGETQRTTIKLWKVG